MISSLGRLRCGLLLALLMATPTRGDAPDSQAIIDGMLSALGGREAIDSLRSLSIEADCTGPGGEFHSRVDSFLPGRTYFRQRAGDSETQIWSTPERTWRRKGDGGFEDLGEEIRYFVRAHEFHLLLLELESRFSNHRSAGSSSMNGIPCLSIEMEDESGQAASLCVAEADSLPLVLEMNPIGAEGPVRVTFDDWRDIGGLRYFFAFTLTEGPERTFTYSYKRIQPDAVPADRFVPPVPPHQQDDLAAILEILRQDRRAHLETDAVLIASNLAETLAEVSAGQINRLSRSAVEGFFTSMFEGATYRMWEDVVPPIIHISVDSTMAWVARTVRVRRYAPGSDGRPVLQAFSSAYTSTYEKRDGVWKMTSVTSTFPPDQPPRQ